MKFEYNVGDTPKIIEVRYDAGYMIYRITDSTRPLLRYRGRLWDYIGNEGWYPMEYGHTCEDRLPRVIRLFLRSPS